MTKMKRSLLDRWAREVFGFFNDVGDDDDQDDYGDDCDVDVADADADENDDDLAFSIPKVSWCSSCNETSLKTQDVVIFTLIIE